MIKVEDLTVYYSNNKHHPSLKDVNLIVHPKEFLCLVGESGSGKTTLLKAIAGLLEPVRGGVIVNDKPIIGGVNTEAAMVFQNAAIMPWLTVYQNIVFPFTMQNKPYEPKKIHAIIQETGLKEYLEKYPRDLSGGQRQRVGIARALAVERKILLLDEPFSALDIKTASELRNDLLSLWKSRDLTVVMVSHLVEEAIELADRVIVLKEAQIHSRLNIDLPRPRDTESAAFIELSDHIKQIIEA